ncbi:hypothetical protein ADK34_33335 [Streptomyces viridochromogenes]|uniref:Pectate lyase superfamily protein domain-containing protein n=2 Tax=Streptomyces TaxID=1883 RepID=A0A0L8JDT3_STRVR|nr:hypothetical protein ADK34_33335 [Streptomyces viridochromogenes]
MTGSMDRRSVIRGMATAGAGMAAGAVVAGGGTAHAAGGGDDPYSVDVISKGADPTGATASDAAFRAAAAEVLASFQPDPISGAVPKKVLVIPPGTYLLTQPDSLLPNVNGEGNGGIVDGLSITGYGKRLSRIVYAPTADDTTLWTNYQRYKNIRISGLTFTSNNATSSFCYAYSSATYGVQDTWYTDVEWRGSWKRGIGLDGPATTSNLNSEMGWDHCQVGGSYSDAFLVIGMTPSASQQDQFLNYWFRDCKVEYQSGVFVKNTRGGSMNFTGGSYILTDTASTGTFFQLTPDAGTRADSVMRLYAQGIRFELRGTGHKVIDSQWYKGNVTFVSCDDTAHSFKSWAPNAVTHVYDFEANGSRGPMVRYVDCALMGSHQVKTGASATTYGKVLYEGCRFMDMSAATGASGFLRWTGTVAPRYELRDCVGASTYLADVKNPA